MHKRKSLVTLLIIGFVASANFLGRLPQDSVFKNLQVLPKDITKTKLDKIMDEYSASLGVKCGFCHVKVKDFNEWDYASDAKGHKKESRDMMRMTNDLNSKYFGVDLTEANPQVAITCYTCHRGEEHPVFGPIVPATPAGNVLDSLRRQ